MYRSPPGSHDHAPHTCRAQQQGPEGKDEAMTMASLTASLVARRDHPRHAGTGHAPLYDQSQARHGALLGKTPQKKPPERKAAEAKAPQRKAPGRKAKTLRLDPGTDRQLRQTAARQGTTQQALMETALKRLLHKINRHPPDHPSNGGT
jgi:hypothetical protein